MPERNAACGALASVKHACVNALAMCNHFGYSQA